MSEKIGLWRKNGIAGGKYLVQRRDGTVPEWPNFVLGAKDPAAETALRAYADEAEKLGFDARFVSDVRELADEFMNYRVENGEGDPDAPPHRKDDPATVAKMHRGETRAEQGGLHQLKTWPEPFAAVLCGIKTHEIRKQDRPYAAGDTLWLREWLPDEGRYTGREVRVVVSCLTNGGEWGLPEGSCVMSIRLTDWKHLC